MPIQKVQIPNSDLSVTIKVRSGQAGVGSYNIKAWGPVGNDCNLLDKDGAFFTQGDDDYTLGLKAKDLSGFFIQSIATLTKVGTIRNWSHILSIDIEGQPQPPPIMHSGKFPSIGSVTDVILFQLCF